MPMAATNQMVAAVVTPCMLVLPLSSSPPPRAPSPVTIWAATRPESPLEVVKAYPTMVNAAEPSAIKAIVRIPAGFSLRCRSIPTQAPQSSARILSEMDPQGYGNSECQLSMSHCISYGNENANGMQREALQEGTTSVQFDVRALVRFRPWSTLVAPVRQGKFARFRPSSVFAIDESGSPAHGR